MHNSQKINPANYANNNLNQKLLIGGDIIPLSPDSPFFNDFKHSFKRTIEPIYGDQTQALEKINLAKDRLCRLFVSKNKVLGCVVFKAQPNNELISYGYSNLIEIKSLFIFNELLNSGKGIAIRLLAVASYHACLTEADGIFVTACSTKPQSICFFYKNGFQLSHTTYNKYVSADEHVLIHPDPLLLHQSLTKKIACYLHQPLLPQSKAMTPLMPGLMLFIAVSSS